MKGNNNKNGKSAHYRGDRKYDNRNRSNDKRGRKPSGKSDFHDTDMDVTNNPAWYTRFPQLTKDAASLWFSNPLGAKVPRVKEEFASSKFVNNALGSVPGIMVLHTILGPGTSVDANSPLNATSRDIYSFIRHANSGHANYNAPDLTMYLLCLDAYYTVWAKMVRAYGVASLVTKTSRYTAVRILEALGFNANDILANMANFRYMINNFAVKLGSYATPGTMDIYRRHTEIYTNLYQDSTSTKAQTYILDPAGYYVYGEESAEGGKLTYRDYPENPMTVLDVAQIFSTFDTVIGSEDMNIISGDILKAYGREGIFNIPAIDSSYSTPVVMDPYMLSQIENATILDTVVRDSLNISQNPTTNQVIYRPSIAGSAARYPKLVLNFHKDNPDVNDIMEATRFMVTFDAYDSELDATAVNACGADIVIGVQVFTYTTDSNFYASTLKPHYVLNANLETTASDLISCMLSSSFAYAPRVTIWSGDYMIADTMDYDEYTTVEDRMLWNLHNTALLSLFDVPRIGFKQ